MRFHPVVLLVLAALPAVSGSTIVDATSETTVLLHTGDELSFEILGTSFGANARSFGLPRYPTALSFSFISAPIEWAGTLRASLGSRDGSVALDFGGHFSFVDGFFSGAGYQGPVSTLNGFLSFSPVLSQELFGLGPALLTLRNDGPDLTVGLYPYTLQQNLYASLAGGSLSVGAKAFSVSVQQASPIPEPTSSALLIAGGVVFCAFSTLIPRISRRKE